MLKGLFTPPQDEEHINRDALREESLDTQEGNDGSVPVVVESEQQHEQQKKRREEGKTSIELFLAQNKSLSEMKGERDGQAGIMLWVNVGIFCFLLFFVKQSADTFADTLQTLLYANIIPYL